jgi:hypothetical protein
VSKNDQHEIEVCFLHQTENAILVNDDGNLKDGVWLPKSQIGWEADEYARGEMITVTAPEWLLKAKGLL